MQPRVGNQAGSSARFDIQTEPSPPVATLEPQPEFELAEGVMEPGRSREEMRMLLLGFGTGLTVGLIFLVYIVIAFTGWLP